MSMPFSSDNNILIDDILREYHAETGTAYVPPSHVREKNLGSADYSLGQIQKNVPTPEEAEAERRRLLPSEEDVRAYMASAVQTHYLNINEDTNYPEPEFEAAEKRFRVNGKVSSSVMYDGEEVDTSADENYIPSVQEVELNNRPSSGTVSAYREHNERSVGKVSVRRRRIEKMSEQSDMERLNSPSDEEAFGSFTSYSIPVAAPEEGEGFDYGDDRVSAYDGTDSASGSFKSYVSSVFAGILYKLRPRSAPDFAGDEQNEDEFLGKELKPLVASKYYGSFTGTLRMRLRIAAILWLFLLWISSGLPVPGLLQSIKVASVMCAAIQLTIMLLCLDCIVNSFINISIGKAGIDFLASVACIVTVADAFMVAKSSSAAPHMPLCVLSSLSLLGVQFASLLSARGLRKALRVPAIGKSIYAVTGENALKDMGITLLKSVRPLDGFVRRTEEAPLDEDLFARLSPFILIAAILLSVAVSLLKKAFSEFLFIFSAILVPAVPCAALFSFALPFFIGSMRIFSSGAAIAGWSGICDVGRSKDIIVTDRDLFPKGTVEIESVRIFADTDEKKIISYAGSMMAPSGMASSDCFAELMRTNGAKKVKIENLEFLPAGGIKGIIQGERVLCGNIDLMRLMNVKVPYKLVDKNSVLIAIDGVLYGIFGISYKPLKKVREALTSLIKSNRHAIFAIRDFNVTPEMLRGAFDIATDGYEFPPYLDRFEISAAKATKESKIAAVVCRETLGPLVDMADAGRSMYAATRVNTGISVAASIVGLLFPFVRFITAGYVTPMQLLILMLFFAVPVLLISFFGIRK